MPSILPFGYVFNCFFFYEMRGGGGGIFVKKKILGKIKGGQAEKARVFGKMGRR